MLPSDRAPLLSDVVAHIDHAKQVGGIDAVGIGTDFDGITCTPEGLDDVSKFPNLTRALLEKGYSTADIKKIYGGNTLRVMRQSGTSGRACGKGINNFPPGLRAASHLATSSSM